MMTATLLHFPAREVLPQDYPLPRSCVGRDLHREFVWPHKSRLSQAWELTGWAVAWLLVGIWVGLIAGLFQ